jgi:hypothetical protein
LTNFVVRNPNRLDRLKDKITYLGRSYSNDARDSFVRDSVNQLKDRGYLVLPDYLSAELVEKTATQIEQRLQKLQFSSPTLAQSLIHEEKHKSLIENYLYGSPEEFKRQGIAFENHSVDSLEEALKKYRPSTLTLPFDSEDSLSVSLWLDPFILKVAATYMGFVPFLTEAYTRRNYPAEFKTMNHFWHRDLNHPFYLLKVFYFFSDCTLETGPHEFVPGSHRDLTVNGKRYFSEEEVAQQPGEPIKSVVKAGTVIIEDTRGLHRACAPDKSFRDLGYAVFMSQKTFRKPRAYYSIDQHVFSGLSEFQKSFIPRSAVKK